MNDQIVNDGIYDFSFSMMVMSTDNDKNKQLCIGNTCATQNDIMSLISKKLF